MHISIIRTETRKIQNQLAAMVNQVINQHLFMAAALENNNKQAALKIIEDDRFVNDQFNHVTSDLEFLIAKTPLGKDLRRTMAYIMIAQDLERIGDYAKYIGNFVIKSKKIDQSSINRIIKIHQPFIKMLQQLPKIINEEKTEEASVLAKSDQIIDQLTTDLRTDLISSLAKKHTKEEIAARVFSINVIAGIERAADHVTHICELITYIVTSKHVDF